MWDASQGPAAAVMARVTETMSLRLPAAANHPLRHRRLRTGLKRCSQCSPASPPTRGMGTWWDSARHTTEERAQSPRQAAETTLAPLGTISMTARPAGTLREEGVRERPGCSELLKPRPGAAPQPPPAAATRSQATPKGHRASESLAGSPPGDLDNHEDRRRHPCMPPLRPKWTWDW